MEQPSTTQISKEIGPYRIVRLIAEGGMGAVYEAIQEPIGRRVAIKCLHPEYARSSEAVTRFFNEACAVNLVEHPSIISVSDFGQAPDKTVYLVMEFLHGETLASRLDRLHSAGRRMALSDLLQISAQIADALTAAHAKGIVHRDLKPRKVSSVEKSKILSPVPSDVAGEILRYLAKHDKELV